MENKWVFGFLAAGLCSVACGADAAAPKVMSKAKCEKDCTPTETDAGGAGPAKATNPAPPEADAGAWKTLIEGDWTIPAGYEGYRCVRLTLDSDVTVGKFRSLSPVGTHHTVLTVDDSATEPDGLTECSAGTNAVAGVFGSGVGTNDFAFPPGVAMKFAKGSQLNLNLHLFNTGTEPISGKSGTLIQTVADDDIQHIAEAVLAGTVNLTIPPGQPVTQTGHCTMDHDSTLIAVIPHMHRTGVHLRAVANSSVMGQVVLRDSDYSFDSQLIYPLDPVVMKQGDTVDVDCTYMNQTADTIHFGQSTTDEMCFAGLTRYPRMDTTSFVCIQ